MSAGLPPDEDGVAIELAQPTAAPAQLRAAAKARLLAASLGAQNPTPERERIAGRYRLVREIGRGGIGSVWEAELAPIGKRVAIKLLRREAIARSGDHAARLLREAQAASAIGHEHIVRVDDFGIDPDSGPFLVMELLRGRALAVEIGAHAPMPWPRVAGILRQLCSALAAAHAIGIVHRDLKPANVFLVRIEGGADHCKLLDFGLCKPQPDADAADALTLTGARLGTPGYMAPEQIRGEAVDGRADLYALGCVAYEMLCGQPPFTSRRAAELIEAHLHDTPSPLVDRAPGTPDAVAQLIARALAKDPAARFADAEAMAAAIAATGIASRAVERTVPAPGRMQAPATVALAPARGRWLAGVSIAAFVGGALGVIAAREEAPVADERAPTLLAPTPPVPVAPQLPVEPAASAPAAVAPVVAPIVEPTLVRKPTRPPRRRAPAQPQPPADPPASPDTPALVDGIRDPFGGR